MKKFWQVKNRSDNSGDLILYGDISNKDFWDEDITPDKVMDDLDELGDIDTLNIRINSNGGNLFAGISLSNIIRKYGQDNNVKTVAYIEGLAASAMTIIVAVCDEVKMYSNSMQMIHNPFGIFMGNSNDLRKAADDLDSMREAMINTYQERTGLDREEIVDMLDEETWLDADMSIEKNFADEKLTSEVAASFNNDNLIMNDVEFDLSKFDKVPNRISSIKNKTNTNNGKDDNDMPFKEFETEKKFNDFKNDLKEEILKGYVKAESVLDKFAEVDLDGDDLEEIVDKVKEVKDDANTANEKLNKMKEDIAFDNRKEKLEDVGVKVDTEDKEEILDMSDKVFKMLVKSNKEKLENSVNKDDDDEGKDFTNFNLDNNDDEGTDVANSILN